MPYIEYTQWTILMNGEAKFALKGRFAVNGDNNKARLISVFDIMRDGEAVTVVVLR